MNTVSQPIRVSNWQPQLFRIESIADEIPGVRTIHLANELERIPSFSPGQFNMLYIPGFGEAAISISSGVHEVPRLSHTFRAVGNVTRALSRLNEGEQIGVRGPFGNPWPIEMLLGKDVIIVAGGIGLAPLRPVIECLLKNRPKYGAIKLVYGAKSPRELLFQEQFSRWINGGLEMEVTVDRGTPQWQGHIGVVTEIIRPFGGDPKKTLLLTCGPEIMMRFVAREAIALGISPSHVFLSLERNMSCAMGMCGVCQFGPEFVCKDGPVFSFDRVKTLLRLEDI